MEYKNIDIIKNITMKYTLLKNDTIKYNGKTLYRIKSLKSFTTFDGTLVKKGDLGGYIENEINLSHCNICWIFPDCIVEGEARVTRNSIIKKNSILSGFILVKENTIIEESTISSEFCVIVKSKIFNVTIKDNIQIDNSIISDIKLEFCKCWYGLGNVLIESNDDFITLNIKDNFFSNPLIISLGKINSKLTIVINDINNHIHTTYDEYEINLKKICTDKQCKKINQFLKAKPITDFIEKLNNKINKMEKNI